MHPFSVPPSLAQPNRPVVLPTNSPSVNMTIGAVTISTWCSVFAFGVVSSTAYYYYIKFPGDKVWTKLLVGAVWLVAAIDTLADLVWAYEWTVTLWGSIPGAGFLPYAFYVNILCDAMATSINQAFYAWRIWVISSSAILPLAIIAYSFTQLCVVGWALYVWAKHHVLFKDLGIVLPGAYIWLISCILGDLIISGSIACYLHFGMRNLPSQSTFDSIVSRTVQANLFSLISQLLTFVLYRIDAGMFFFLNDVVIAKVYAFSLLVSLNARGNSPPRQSTAWTTGVSGGNSLGRRPVFIMRDVPINEPTEHDYASAYSPSSKAGMEWDAPDLSQTNAYLPGTDARDTDISNAY